MAHGGIEKIAGSDAGGIVVVVLGSDRGYFYKVGSELRCRTRRGQRSGGGCADAIAGESGLELLIGAQGVSENILQQDGGLPVESGGLRAVVDCAYAVTRRVSGYQTAVVTPVEAKPGAALPGLVLQVGGLVELFVVVDAEGKSGAGRHRRAGSADLGLEEARRHAGKDHQRREAMEIRHADAAGVSGNFGVVPFNRESDRGIAEHAEIVAIVRVFRDPLTGKDQVLAEGLLDASVEFIAKAGAQCAARQTRTEKERG